MTAPAIFGHVPLVLGKVDSRWLAVKDSGIDVRFTGVDVAHKTDNWVNYHVKYKRDTVDEWSTPMETYQRRYGDCEDLALVKRAMLLRSGVPENHIYFVLVKDVLSKQDHAILVVYYEHAWVVLDSFNSLTLPVQQVKDYMPIMAFSGGSAWLYGRKR